MVLVSDTIGWLIICGVSYDYGLRERERNGSVCTKLYGALQRAFFFVYTKESFFFF